MSDSGNIFIRGEKWGDNPRTPGVFFYTHWAGYTLPFVLSEALNSKAGRARKDDPPYLARIIFCRMVKDDIEGETGYGISGSLPNNSYPVLAVDALAGRVHVVPDAQADLPDEWIDEHPELGLNFEEFIAIATEDWAGLKAAVINRLGQDPF